ncbi:MAG: TspO/MBR family protein [Pseudomonadota bacterium]
MDWSLAVFLVAAFAASSSAAVWKPDEWYRDLAKPSWNPKDWVFPVVWTPLYVGMAVSAWLVWVADAPGTNFAIGVWCVQLVFNAAWSWVFFGLKKIRWALIELSGLWLSVAATIAVFWPIDPIAGALLLPYLRRRS